MTRVDPTLLSILPRYREEHPEEHCVEKNKIECGLCQGKRVEHDRGKLLRHFR